MGKGHLSSVFVAIEQLQTLSHLFMKKRAVLAREVGLTEAQWRLLEEIQHEDFMPSMFASRRDYSKAAVSKLLRQLQEKQLIEAASGGTDGRTRKFKLTDQGNHCLNRLRETRMAAIDEIWMTIDAKLLKKSNAFNELLIENLRRSMET